MRTVDRGVLRVGLAAAIAVPVLGACRQPPDRTEIAVLTSGVSASLASEPGRSAFVDRISARCPDCVVTDAYDGATAAAARAAVADGADVLVVEALTSELGEEVVVAAGSVPVVAFDRYVAGADWLVTYDHTGTGTAVADAVEREVDGRGRVLIVDGSAVDADTDVIETGIRDGLAGQGVEVLAELAAATGTAEEARAWTSEQLSRPGAREVAAVLATTDEQARGVLEAFEEAGLRRPWPVVTGTGGDLDAVRRVVAGDQTLTVHMPVARTAQTAADVALSLASAARGSDLEGETSVEGVPAFVYDPVVVSTHNVTDTVVRDGTFTPEEICAGDVAAACTRLGIR